MLFTGYKKFLVVGTYQVEKSEEVWSVNFYYLKKFFFQSLYFKEKFSSSQRHGRIYLKKFLVANQTLQEEGRLEVEAGILDMKWCPVKKECSKENKG